MKRPLRVAKHPRNSAPIGRVSHLAFDRLFCPGDSLPILPLGCASHAAPLRPGQLLTSYAYMPENSLVVPERHLLARRWRGFLMAATRVPMTPLQRSVWLPIASPP